MADYVPSQVREKFNLSDLFQQAFGYTRAPFPQVGIVPQINPFGFVKALRGSFHFRGNIGNEYIMPVAIGTDLDNLYQIPCEPSVGIFAQKDVVITKLTRLDPQTKKQAVQNIIEETALNNYRVRIRGVIYNEDDFYTYPEDSVSKLRTLYETPGAKSIVNVMCDIMQIHRITILDVDWPELPGYPGAQPFEIRAISDDTELYPLERV